MKKWDKITKDYKEHIMYVICGVLTTIVNFAIFIIAIYFNIPIGVSNTMAFIGAVLFAYGVNRKYVFVSNEKKGLKKTFVEIVRFFGSRITTFLIESLLLYIVLILSAPPILGKAIISIVTLILNYVLSKFIVFK